MHTLDRAEADDTLTPATAEAIAGPSRKVIAFLIATVLMNSIGFTIIMPVAPFIIRQYLGNSANLAQVVGWLAATYALCEFIAAPGLGALSDRYGRRPLLLVCLLGSAIGYLIFGIAGALWVLFLGRIIDGLTGGNISILFAYVGDVTPPERRGEVFGQVGAMVGIGFLIGPVLGGFAAQLGYSVPAYIAAAICLANTLWGYLFMPESLSVEHRRHTTNIADLNPIGQLGKLFRIVQLRWLLVVGICYAFPFALFTTELGVLSIEKLGWGPGEVGLVSLLVGGTDIVMQGVLAGRLLPIVGPIKLTIAGLLAEIASYLLVAAVAFVPSPLVMLAGVFMFAFGSGLLEPALGGLVSEAAGPREQGMVQGGNQAIRALLNIGGPLLAGLLYTQFGEASPFVVGAAILGLGIIAAALAVPFLPARQPEPDRAEA
ncbi:MAG TPA: MFS transporter [Roseiflexaceae bacterium]|nr:MFS transporter [Roseiflexaceae bacterium]